MHGMHISIRCGLRVLRCEYPDAWIVRLPLNYGDSYTHAGIYHAMYGSTVRHDRPTVRPFDAQ